ncbi:hypothetical protein R3W88_026834 [Solanum pinnatisectum]|uniref:RNase H type-1 domain-containing protein n=1 Tax=Solanum pinnatisectum TaxID=50273 RepID=A0AAV9LHS5_9SOLN|nr:hypothetical protein R3W88_026834 [Solanum pinnatisectum]
MIENQWKVPWELIEIIEDIRVKLQSLQGNIIHIFREGNTVADALANEVIEAQNTKDIRSQINMEKSQIPNLRIRTRRISRQ